MNWYQSENDIRTRFAESEAGGRRSRDLQELDLLHRQHRDSLSRERRAWWLMVGRTIAGWFRLSAPEREAPAGSAQPRVTRAFRQK